MIHAVEISITMRKIFVWISKFHMIEFKFIVG